MRAGFNAAGIPETATVFEYNKKQVYISGLESDSVSLRVIGTEEFIKISWAIAYGLLRNYPLIPIGEKIVSVKPIVLKKEKKEITNQNTLL